jgi:crotonobetainyl-CoA:carnitine CoA-transferase CaiB-like acyl-CoA transferase
VTETRRTLPLDGIKVLDFSQAMSGPACSMLLADFGADVIKIEPQAGDSSRKWGSARYGKDNEFSSMYLALNRNKRSISVNLKHPDGIAMIHRMAKQADVVLENFKPGVMARLGIGYEALAKINPRIVYCAISGFGQTGPLAARPGYDQLMQAYAGLLSVTGEANRTAVRIGPSAIDILTGSNAAFGILAALRERDRSGRGQAVDTSLYESAIHMMTHMIVDYSGTSRLPEKTGPYFSFLAPYGIFMSSNREFYIGASSQAMWTKLCTALGRLDLTEDPRFLTNAERSRNQRQLYDILEPIFKADTAEHWVALAESLDIPTSLLHDLSEVVGQEQARAREAVVPVAGQGAVRSAGIPIKLSDTPGTIRNPPPSLAANAKDILTDFGFDAGDIARLSTEKVIG